MQPTERQLADFAQGIRQNDVYEQMRLSRATHSTRDESGQNIAARGTASPPQEMLRCPLRLLAPLVEY
jgi:hypothetical protein